MKPLIIIQYVHYYDVIIQFKLVSNTYIKLALINFVVPRTLKNKIHMNTVDMERRKQLGLLYR